MNTKSIIRLENKNLSQFHNAKAQTVVLFRPVEKKKNNPVTRPPLIKGWSLMHSVTFQHKVP